MNQLIQTLFVGAVGLSVSALGTWAVYLTLMVFDLNTDVAEIRKDDNHLEYRVDQVESDVDQLLRDMRDR
jgi:hypothetical protein